MKIARAVHSISGRWLKKYARTLREWGPGEIRTCVRARAYFYEYEDELYYPNQIKVKYLWYHPWPERSDQKIINALGKQGTLKKIDEKWIWEYIISNYFKKS